MQPTQNFPHFHLYYISVFLLFHNVDTKNTFSRPNIQQKTTKNTEQCPCLQKQAGGSSQCMKYDTTRLAASLDEAMTSFPNLPSQQQKTLFEKTPETKSSAKVSTFVVAEAGDQRVHPATDGSCDSAQCTQCKKSLIMGMIENSNGKVDEGLWKAKESLSSSDAFSSSSDNLSSACGIQSKPHQSTNKQSETTNEIVNILHTEDTKRGKRETNDIHQTNDANSTGLLGTWVNVACDYRRGDALDTNGEWCGLCNLCWRWRRLPDEYFPQFINEVSCATDVNCLSGYGSCRPLLRPISVLKNYGSNTTSSQSEWKEFTISFSVGCECQVKMGTPLHDLVLR